MKYLLYAAAALALASCNDQPAPTGRPQGQLAFNDFEAVEGWASGAAVPSLTTDKAHSGTTAVVVQPGIDFSLGYNNLLGKLGDGKARKIRVRAWVLLPNAKATAVLVTQLRDEAAQKDVLWQGLPLAQATKTTNQWVQVEKEVTLPATAAYTNRVLVYLWRNDSSQPVYLDDLEISRLD